MLQPPTSAPLPPSPTARSTEPLPFGPTAEPAPSGDWLGAPGQPVRALAFGGGLFDTAMQLGVAHALLVSRARHPDVVVGVSAGAVNAATLIEVLQAGGDGSANPSAKLAAQTGRLREILEIYCSAPDELQAAMIPDIYQIERRAPLKPVALPIHFDEERQARDRAARSRAGLIQLTNDLLRLDLSVVSLTRLVRAFLGWRAAGEFRSLRARILAKLIEGFRIWRVFLMEMRALAPLGTRLFLVALHPNRLPPESQPGPVTRAARWIWDRLTGQRPSGTTAGELIFFSRSARLIRERIGLLFGFIGLCAAIAVPPASIAALALLIVSALREFGLRPGPTVWLEAGWLLVGIGLAVGGVAVVLGRALSGDRLLGSYGIANGLLDPHSLRTLFVRLFDRDYYGKSSLSEILESGLARDEPEAMRSRARSSAKTIAETGRAHPPIHFAPIAANVATGKPTVLPQDTPLVDALLAATAYPPFFEAQPLDMPNSSAPEGGRPERKREWFVDGAIVANEPTESLVEHLRARVHEDISAVHIYSVSPLPLSAPELKGDRESYPGLIESAWRALTLQRFRDAMLQRRLTEVVSSVITGKSGVWWEGRARQKPRPPEGAGVRVRAHVIPIEPDKITDVTQRVTRAKTPEQRRTIVSEAVADGCRATLQTILKKSLGELDRQNVGAQERYVPCRAAVAARLGMAAHDADAFLPGTGAGPGAGLSKVCGACVLNRASTYSHQPGSQYSQFLRERNADGQPDSPCNIPDWPLDASWQKWGNRGTVERRTDEQPSEAHVHQTAGEGAPARPVVMPDDDEAPSPRFGVMDMPGRVWPVLRDPTESAEHGERPTVSLLFSGGVFRGVYIAGVINALNEMGIQPDMVAGASIGSITAAAAARIFAVDGAHRGLGGRRDRIARLAATFLTIDRLVVTDRFADFIRGFTLRAGTTVFSPRQADGVFRIYERSGSVEFGDDIRDVVAGLERLLYVSPFELTDFVKAVRLRRRDQAWRLLGRFAQEWLERGSVGAEILGAEPLQLLIREHVIEPEPNEDPDAAAERVVQEFGRQGIQFLATVTNLTAGKLERFYAPDLYSTRTPPRLVEVLLASSAFPAVFRPRWSWEVVPNLGTKHQFIDGGVMDNLPLDAVARFLDKAFPQPHPNRRPRVGGRAVPHLMFTASLEVERRMLTDETARDTAASWQRTRKRAEELKYNNKIRSYHNLQKTIRSIWGDLHASGQTHDARAPYTPLDLEVISVRPQWLCGTFAFHPMLGFRREKQARSIAHGCYGTLERMHRLKVRNPEWVKAWKLDLTGFTEKWPDTPLQKTTEEAGHCWWRKGKVCPFSEQGLKESQAPERQLSTRAHEGSDASKRRSLPLGEQTQRELQQIYRLCRERKTHESRTKEIGMEQEGSKPVVPSASR